MILKLLHESTSDSSALCVGELISELFKKLGPNLGNSFIEIIKAILMKLDTSKSVPLCQQLVIVFAQLIHTNLNDFLNLLTNIQINGKKGLQILFSKWSEIQTSFCSQYHNKVR